MNTKCAVVESSSGNIILENGGMSSTIKHNRSNNKSLDAIESFLLALHCEGVDINADATKFNNALETALEAIDNNLQ